MEDDAPMSENSHATPLTGALRVGDWTVHPDLNRLERGGEIVQVEPRLIQVLCCLAREPGRVYGREELLDLVWGDVVVGEESLTRTISELRRILGDDTQDPRYIETIRKKGYRLLAEAEPVAPVVAPEPVPVADAPAVKPRRARRVVPALLAIAAVLIAAWWFRPARDPSAGPRPPLRSVPLTSSPGLEIQPALSDDGRAVVFAWNGPDGENWDIYVKEVGEESPLRLTENPARDTSPAWHPGGRSIAFVRSSGGTSSIWTVPLFGGEPRQLFADTTTIWGFAWDGEDRIIYSRAESVDTGALYHRRLGDAESRRLIANPEGTWDYLPRLSPDGSMLAFLRRGADWHTDIYVAEADGGSVRRLTEGLDADKGLCWDRDGASLIFGSRLSGHTTLWRVDVRDAARSWVPIHGEQMMYPSAARHADRLAYQMARFERNIWSIRAGRDRDEGIATSPLVNSSSLDDAADHSPDGRHIAFRSTRSGNQEIWACQIDGEHPVQLTDFGGVGVGSPRWSPEGSRIAFVAQRDGYANLHVADYAERTVRRLTDGPHHDLVPTWSGDGRWLYCGSNRDGAWRIWRVPADGDPTRVAHVVLAEEGVVARETPQGDALLFTRPGQAGIWRVALEDGVASGSPEVFLPDVPAPNRSMDWDLWPGGLVLADTRDGATMLLRHDFTSGVTSTVTAVPSFVPGSLSVDRDGAGLLYARIENRVVDLVLVEGFR